MSTTTSRGYPKATGADLARDYLKTTLSAGMDTLNADMLLALGLGRQQLVNGGMEINQRGGTVTADLGYGPDRWQFLKGGTSTISITDETTIVDTGSGHALKAVYVQGSVVSQIDQKLEAFAQLRGKTVTFSIRVRKGVASSVRPYIRDSVAGYTYGATSVTTGSFTTLTMTAGIAAAATFVRVGVELSISDTVYLDNATLVIGSVAMDYVPVSPAVELAECMRYYEVIGGVAGERFAMLQAYSTTRGDGGLFFRVVKAVTPTVTISAAGDFFVYNATGGSVTCTALVAATISVRSCDLDFTVGTAVMAAGSASVLSGLSAARVVIEANI